jgi:hypothetical protein
VDRQRHQTSERRPQPKVRRYPPRVGSLEVTLVSILVIVLIVLLILFIARRL